MNSLVVLGELHHTRETYKTQKCPPLFVSTIRSICCVGKSMHIHHQHCAIDMQKNHPSILHFIKLTEPIS
jgi:hypothetical protein